MRKWAYMGVPHTGGTYSVFTSLRKGLREHGVELRWVGVGAGEAKMAASGAANGELELGTVVAPAERDDKRQGAALVEFFAGGNYEGVFVNVLSGRVSTNFVRYLWPGVRRILIAHTTTIATYAAARVVRDYVHAAVGVSPRIARDLIAHNGFNKASTVAIANAIEVERFSAADRTAFPDYLRIVFLGRVEDTAKGCLLLPRIIEQVNRSGVRAQCTIAGDGPDLARLKRRCADLSNVRFLGAVPREAVPDILSDADVYLFPSRYEGFGLSLVEAMASGCVPVASAISGVTDTIVEHGTTGWLFPIGHWRRAADYVMLMALDPARRREMSLLASHSVRNRFSMEQIAWQYAAVMDTVASSPRPLSQALDVRRWSYPRGLRDGWRTYLPEGVKQRLRVVRERFITATA